MRAKVELGTDQGGGGSAISGTASLRAPTADTNSISLHIALPLSGSQTRIEYLAVHEFGHTIGFDHEQERSDNDAPPDPTCNPSGGISSGFHTFFDRNSIMHYCGIHGNNSGQLSDQDKLGIEILYPFTLSRNGRTLAYAFQTTSQLVTREDDFYVLDWTLRGAPPSTFGSGITWRVDGLTATFGVDFPMHMVNNYGFGPHELSGSFVGAFGQTQHVTSKIVLASNATHTAIVVAALGL
ncbi:MAG: hypothetical protein SFW67_14745 [Myxococcaceae bacterium]|nr:hypothetical protein [Myxococcaceae bacterium]